MAQATIKCPKCGETIEISQAISHDIEIEIKRKYEKDIEAVRKDSARMLKHKDIEAEEKIKKERKVLEAKIKKEAEEAQRFKMNDLKGQLEEKSRRLEMAEQKELELRKQQRELEDKKKSFELEMNRRLDSERQQIAEKASKDAEESHRLKDAEKDKQLADMRRQIGELKRKAEQGSQKVQGEVLELELEEILKNEFPFDEIEPVPPGIKGADAIQVVKTQTGKVCGKLLWETKRTKAWSDSWLQKVKDDKREVKADIAILVSETLPKGLAHFRMIDGIWVTSVSTALSLAWALRMLLIQVAREKELQSGKKGKMELVYNYLTGPEFRNRVEAIVESFIQIKNDLDAERRAMNKIWDKREKQIERVILNIGGMHSDLEGIAGMTLPAIKMLELPVDKSQFQINEKDQEISQETNVKTS